MRMAPVRVVHAFRLPMIAAMTALGLSGCMHTSGPVATAQPSSDLDYMAYGHPHSYSARRRAAFSRRRIPAMAAARSQRSARVSPRRARSPIGPRSESIRRLCGSPDAGGL